MQSEINDHFTIAFEFELECDDDNLKMPETLKTLITLVKQQTIERLEEEEIIYKEKFIDDILLTFDKKTGDFGVDESNFDDNQSYVFFIIQEVMEEEFETWVDESDEELPLLGYGENMVKKHLPNFYKKWSNILKFEFDDSLKRGIEFSPKTFVKSIKSATEMIEDFFNDFDKQNYWYMNNNTSIHINIGLDKGVEWNISKGIILLKDFNEDDVPFIFKGIESRQNTAFTNSLYKLIVDKLKESNLKEFNIKEIESFINKKLEEAFETMGSKHFGFNINQIKKFGYAEFRYVGGSLSKELVIDKLLYFSYIVYIMTSKWKEKDYIKKLYKLSS